MAAETAEVVAVDVLVRLDEFDGRTKQSAADFGSEMAKIKRSAEQAEQGVERSMDKTARAVGKGAYQSRQLGLQIGQIGSQVAVGTSPFIIMAQQASDLVIALDGVPGPMSKIISFFGTWQGALLLAGLTIAATMIPNLLKFNDELEDSIKKLEEDAKKTDLNRRAKEEFGRTLIGVKERVRDLREELEKLDQAQSLPAEKALEAAKKLAEDGSETLEAGIKRLEGLRDRLTAAIEARGAGRGGRRANANELIRLNKELERTNSQLERARAGLASLQQNVAVAQSFLVVEQALLTEEEQINRLYAERIDNARKLALANGTVDSELRKQVDSLEAARDAELERLRAAKKVATDNLPPVTRSEVAGALQTSINPGGGIRTVAQNRAAGGAANSYHLGGAKADVQAIDIPLTVGGKPLTKAGIRAVLEPLGIEIKELLGPGDKDHDDHFHIAFARKRVGADRLAEDAAKAAEAEEKRRQAFENELANLLGDEIDARQALVTAAEEIAAFELDSIQISRDKYNDNLASLVEQKKLTAEEADQLRDINNERARLRVELVKRREDERKFRMAEAERQRQAQFEGAERGDMADLLGGQLDLARTQEERRALERRLIELQYQEERARNDYLIAFHERLKIQEGVTESELKDAEAAARIAELRNASLEARQANTLAKSDQGTAGPLEAFLDTIPDTAGEINEALEAVAAGGLTSLVDGLTDAIVNFRSLGDVGLAALQQLTAALVKMALQQLILKAIGETLGTGAVSATSAQAAASAAAWAPAAALASLATLGANAGPAAAALAATTALSAGLAMTGGIARADGGPIFGPGGPRDDRIPVWGSNGEYMIKASSATKLGRAALDQMNLTGQLPLSQGQIEGRVSPSNASARQGGSAGMGGEANLSEASVRQLAQIVGEAMAAMPDVKLFPTFTPQAAAQAMLSDPGAQRMFFDFFGANSGKMRATINQ